VRCNWAVRRGLAGVNRWLNERLMGERGKHSVRKRTKLARPEKPKPQQQKQKQHGNTAGGI